VGVVGEARFPYVPGLLSFREAPAVLDAFRRLQTRPDVVLCDGQGTAHPRRMGLACHLGLWLNVPTIGCAKSRLCGTYDEPGPARGDRSPLVDRCEVVGAVVRTRARVNPVYVSPGHLCDLESAVEIVLASTPKYRLPLASRLAHDRVNELRRSGGGGGG
jgi:deoxyribonuclease V